MISTSTFNPLPLCLSACSRARCDYADVLPRCTVSPSGLGGGSVLLVTDPCAGAPQQGQQRGGLGAAAGVVHDPERRQLAQADPVPGLYVEVRFLTVCVLSTAGPERGEDYLKACRGGCN